MSGTYTDFLQLRETLLTDEEAMASATICNIQTSIYEAILYDSSANFEKPNL